MEDLITLISVIQEGYFLKGVDIFTGYEFMTMCLALSDSILYVTDGSYLYNMTHVEVGSSSNNNNVYDMQRYDVLVEFMSSQAWSGSAFILGVAAVSSRGCLYLTLSYGVNVILKTPMKLSRSADIQVIAGDISKVFSVLSIVPPFKFSNYPLSKNGFVGNSPQNVTLSFPSHITYDPNDDALYFVEGQDLSNVTSLTYSMGGPSSSMKFGLPLSISFAYTALDGPVLFVADFISLGEGILREMYNAHPRQTQSPALRTTKSPLISPYPTKIPVKYPTRVPLVSPTRRPQYSDVPSTTPSMVSKPSVLPSRSPSASPHTLSPSENPLSPTTYPISSSPVAPPSSQPTNRPSKAPFLTPTIIPSIAPSTHSPDVVLTTLSPTFQSSSAWMVTSISTTSCSDVQPNSVCAGSRDGVEGLFLSTGFVVCFVPFNSSESNVFLIGSDGSMMD
eukprot:gene40131-53015_t